MRLEHLITSRGVIRLLVLACAFGAANLGAAEVMPPKPAGYFNDYANVVPKEAALRLNEQLAQFERETSNQIVVAVYPKMETDSDIFDYTYRIKEQWGVGQKDRNNGAVLFVYVQDRKMFVQVNYGLEGVLPDATAKDITENVIKPRFKGGDYPGGLSAGVDAILKACKGEYQGSGKTVLEGPDRTARDNRWFTFFIFLFILVMLSRLFRKSRGYGYSGRGGTDVGGWGGGWGSSGGGWSSGSSSGGGFSGFSGGGGGGGGGGAGSSW